MKKMIQLLVMCAVLTGSAAAQVTSTGSGEWNTPATWSTNAVPISTDNVVIDNNHVVTLTTTAGSCANLKMNPNSSLSINTSGLAIPGTSWNLDVTSTVIFNGGTTVQTGPAYGNLTYTSANGGISTSAPASLTINGNLTINGTGAFRGIATTSGSVTHTVMGDVIVSGASAKITGVNNSSATTATCTWNIHGSLKLTGNSSNNRVQMYESAGPHTGSAVFNIDGNLEVGTSSQLMFKSSSNTTNNFPEGVVNVKGNFVHNGVISSNGVTSGTSTGLSINFTGTSQQTWSGTGSVSIGTNGFPVKFTINNSAGVTLGAPKTVGGASGTAGTLALTNGHLTTTPTNLLTMGATGVFSGGSSSSFINGPMSQTWTTVTAAKSYPLGKGSAYRPLEISLTTPASAVIRAEVFNSNAGGSSSLNQLSLMRYYQTSLTSGTAASGGTVKMTFGADDGVLVTGNLVVAQSSTSNGVYSTLGASASDASSVTSSSYDPSLGDFLILGSTNGNPLPVEIVSFTAVPRSRSVELNWETATEVNNVGFNIERRTESEGWKTLGFVEGNGTTNSQKSYMFIDRGISSGSYQYRLKQIDRNGAFEYSPVINAVAGISAEEYHLSQNYPNPFNPTTTFTFAMKNQEHVTVSVFNLLGQKVATLFNGTAEAHRLYSMTFDGSTLSSGLYFYTLRSNSRNETRKMLFNK